MSNNENELSEVELIQTLYKTTLDHDTWPTLFESFVSFTDNMDNKLDFSQKTIGEHISQALALKEKLITNQNMINHVFDRLPFGVIFLDSQLDVQHHNYYGYQFLLAQHNQAHLGNKLQQVIRAKPKNQTSITFTETIEEKDYYLGVFEYEKSQTTKYILYIYDNSTFFDKNILKENYQITPAETRMLNSLLQHGDTQLAAQDLKINISTLRSHLKSVYRKTDTHNQTALMVKLLSGVQLLSELTDQMDSMNQQITDEPFVELGDSKGYLVFYIPSMFNVTWDFLGDQIFGWRRFFEKKGIHLVIVNTSAMIDNERWKNDSLSIISDAIAAQITTKYKKKLKKPCYLIANNTGCAFALNLLTTLQPTAVKLVSPCLPKKYMQGNSYPNPDYQKMSVANQIPRRMWLNLAPYTISQTVSNPSTYFARKLKNQRHDKDRYKVNLWLESTLLQNMFADYAIKARYKMAFDLMMIGNPWPIQTIHCPIECIAGEHDSYTSLEGIAKFSAAHSQVTHTIISDSPATFDTRQWEDIFSVWS